MSDHPRFFNLSLCSRSFGKKHAGMACIIAAQTGMLERKSPPLPSGFRLILQVGPMTGPFTIFCPFLSNNCQQPLRTYSVIPSQSVRLLRIASSHILPDPFPSKFWEWHLLNFSFLTSSILSLLVSFVSHWILMKLRECAAWRDEVENESRWIPMNCFR